MGDEFDADGPSGSRSSCTGPGRSPGVDVIKDFVYVFSNRTHGPARRVPVDRRGGVVPPAPVGINVRALQRRRRDRLGGPLWVNTRGTGTAAAGR